MYHLIEPLQQFCRSGSLKMNLTSEKLDTQTEVTQLDIKYSQDPNQEFLEFQVSDSVLPGFVLEIRSVRIGQTCISLRLQASKTKNDA